MLCEECNKRNATVHMTKITQGKKKEVHLCNQCAKEKENINFENPFSIHNFLAGLLDIHTDPHPKTEKSINDQCNQCGTTYDDFKQTGRLGCSSCYEHFNEKLIALIKRIHGNENHIGKIPKKASEKILVKREMENLKLQLVKAVTLEEFEKAADLRDMIKKLDSQIQEK
jgi:protein arginine kinase activator